MQLKLSSLIAFTLFVLIQTPRPSAANAYENKPFRFSAYCNYDDMKETLRAMLPRGTDRNIVEQKLVKEGGARILLDEAHQSRPNYVQYSRPTTCSTEDTQWQVNVTYDRRGKVWQISATGIASIFPHLPPTDRADGGVFDFADYDDRQELTKTVAELFPPDTSRTEVERVLVKWNGAQVWERAEEPRSIIYRRSIRTSGSASGVALHDRIWNIEVTYIDDVVSQIRVDGSIIQTAFQHTREYWLKHKKQTKSIVREEQ